MKIFFEEFIENESSLGIQNLIKEYLELSNYQLNELGFYAKDHTSSEVAKNINKYIEITKPADWLLYLFDWSNNYLHKDFETWRNIHDDWCHIIYNYNPKDIYFFKDKIKEEPVIIFEGD